MQLDPHAVHVWHATSRNNYSLIGDPWTLLDQDERERTSRYKFPHDRERFACVRAWTRTVLAAYLNMAPKDIRFVYGSAGKPAVLPACAHHPLHFNLSHSKSEALMAVSRQYEVGIDIEQIDFDLDFQGIAERLFTVHEQQALAALPLERKAYGFFRCWTHKEAYVKCLGKGLGIPLNEFEVEVDPAKPALLVSPYRTHSDEMSCSQYDLDLGTEFAAALSVNGRPEVIRMFAASERTGTRPEISRSIQ